MNRSLAVVAVVFVVVIALSCWVGWITFHKSPEKATIEIQTQQMEQAGEKAVEKSRELVEKAADSVKQAVRQEHGEKTTTTTSSPSPPGSPD